MRMMCSVIIVEAFLEITKGTPCKISLKVILANRSLILAHR
jgi:hypothetical protein